VTDLIRDDGLTIARAWHDGAPELDGAGVAVSGASGLIGRHVVAVLLGLADVHGTPTTVFALGRNRAKLEAAFATWRDDPRLRLVEADLADGGSWPPTATHLIQAASPATPGAFADDPVGVIRANVLATLRGVDQAVALGARYCYISSMEVYGAVPRQGGAADQEIDERAVGLLDPLDVRSAYPESKRLCEALVVAAARQHGLRGDIVRLSHTYGPGMGEGDDRVQAELVRQAVRGEPVVLKSDGALRRHYTYAADAAAAIVRILATSGARTAPAAFNVADSDARVSIKQLAELVLTAAGRSPGELVVAVGTPDARLWSKAPGAVYLATTKLRALGWAPVFSLNDGMARTVEYARGQVAR